MELTPHASKPESEEAYTKNVLKEKIYRTRSGQCRSRASRINVPVCRICFATNCKLYSMTMCKNLYQGYESVTGLPSSPCDATLSDYRQKIENVKIHIEDNLPRYLCYECAHRLQNFVQFRSKSLRAHLILQEAAKKHDSITPELIHSIFGNKNHLSSNLVVTHNKPDCYDLQLEHIEEKNVPTEEEAGAKNSLNSQQNILEFIKVEDTINHEVPQIEETGKANSTYALQICNIKVEIESGTEEDELDEPDTSNSMLKDAFVVKVEKTEVDELSTQEQSDENVVITYDLPCDMAGYQANLEDENNSSEKLFPCAVCKKAFNNENSVRKHFKSHFREKRYICNVCMKAFAGKSDLQDHLRVHSGERPFCCEVCKKVFSRKGNLRSHLRTHTGERPYSCDVCMKSFRKKDNLQTHLRIHSGEKPYTCEVCKKAFSKNVSLKSHLRTHSGEKRNILEKVSIKPFSCEICKKAFTRRGSLKTHMRIHSGEKPYCCQVCNKTFADQGYFGKHLKAHYGDKPFSCDECDKCFSYNSDLRIHMRTHSGEKPYACDVCKKAFHVRSNLRNHLRIHSATKPFKCNICMKAFYGKGDLRKHVKVHSDEKPYSCEVCNKAFNKNSNLKKHFRLHSGERPYTCDVCLLTFSDKCNLNKHYKKHIV